MDFYESPDQQAFRAEARAWIDSIIGDRPNPAPHDQGEREADARWFQERMYADGWVGLSWPTEYGGRGLTAAEESIFNEEAALVGAPLPINNIGINLAGPTIMVHGNGDQKQRYLDKILSGEQIWCQGFSEPGSGSDLASLATRAERVDGGWRITGQKVWTSWGHLAQKCLLLARTDPDAPKHAGISYFLADTDEIDIRPLVMINSDAEFNEMFIDDLFVPDEDVLGQIGEGWRYALSTLGFERGTIGFNLQVWAQQALDELISVVEVLGLSDDAAVVDRVGAFTADVLAVKVGGQRAMSVISSGGVPGPETSIGKLLWARTVQDINRYALELLGASGATVDHPVAGGISHNYLRSRGHSIEGGTDEVQKSIIAERVLGLPRSR